MPSASAVPRRIGSTTSYGSSWASAQRPEKTPDGSTPAQEVFGTPLILPGQFLDSPELPPKTFLEPFSKTLSAAEHSATRHNIAAARRPPPQLPDDLARAPTVFVKRDGQLPPLQPLYDGPYTVIRPFPTWPAMLVVT